ncbi:hypothetical protein HYW74_01055 [Candidatus Pacearchaeota archaeon]|nr:hypothetical protein [Candidatus Pacearchaeota archaeon]
MKHISKLSKIVELPLIADEKYNPDCFSLGYVEGIISGGGDIYEVFSAIIVDRLCGLGLKKLYS